MVTGSNFTRELPRTRECARLAREFLEDSIPHSPSLDSSRLIASELVSNAFQYGNGAINISLEVGEQLEVKLSVISGFDLAAKEPNLTREVGTEGLVESGRGLLIVDSLSSRWGWDISGSTLIVWADVSVD